MAALLAPASRASAATITVGSTADTAPSSSACVLRDAITAANGIQAVNGCPAGSMSETDLIRFAAGVTGTIALQSALPQITGATDVEGPGAAQLDLHRAGGAPAFRILRIGNAAVTVSGVTVSNGLVEGSDHQGVAAAGGGISSLGDLTLDGVTVTGNRVSATLDDYGLGGAGTAQGGGIASNGSSLAIVRSRITGNTAESTAARDDSYTEVEAVSRAGGVFASDPEVTIERSTISGNLATATRTGGLEADSRAVAFGGGLATGFGDPGDSLVIDRSTISSNTTTVSHPADSGLPDDSAIGGGIGVGPEADINTVSMKMIASTVALNSAQSGGGIFVAGGRRIATVDGSTIAANSAASAANLGMSQDTNPASEFELADTIVARPEGGGLNCDFPIISAGHNLEGPNPGSSPPSCRFDDQTDQADLDPQLGPLADNGGPTLTMAPLPTSPAIDRGSSPAPTSDQRGVPRPTDLTAVTNWPSSDGTDIGGVELQPGEVTRDLTVERRGTGTGSVSSAPAGIGCGSTCVASYLYGTAVTLSATPAQGSDPVRWSGCDSVDGSNRCVVAMTGARRVVARFDAVPDTSACDAARARLDKAKAALAKAKRTHKKSRIKKAKKKVAAARADVKAACG